MPKFASTTWTGTLYHIIIPLVLVMYTKTVIQHWANLAVTVPDDVLCLWHN